MATKKPVSVTEDAVPTDKEKYLTEIKEMVEELKVVDEAWAKMKGLESTREMLMLAIAERKGIIAYINMKGE